VVLTAEQSPSVRPARGSCSQECRFNQTGQRAGFQPPERLPKSGTFMRNTAKQSFGRLMRPAAGGGEPCAAPLWSALGGIDNRMNVEFLLSHIACGIRRQLRHVARSKAFMLASARQETFELLQQIRERHAPQRPLDSRRLAWRPNLDSNRALGRRHWRHFRRRDGLFHVAIVSHGTAASQRH
jgi:hypothetical protein